MADYYQLLGIRHDASSTEIRTAYKKLAMLYHPDRNPDNKEAEELFKLINEAYHVLADPLKRSNYNARFSFHPQSYHSSAHDTSEYWRQYHRQRYEQWRQAQQGTYRFDRRYFRIQALAIGVFLVMAGCCFAFINVIEYFQNQQFAEAHRENLAHIRQVNVLFNSGKQEEAFTRIQQLQQQEPLAYIFAFTEDSLITSLRTQANTEFESKLFEQSVHHYKLLKKYEQPVRILTLQRIAECEYYTGRFEESLVVLKELVGKQPGNIDLLYRIAIIYQDDVRSVEQAAHYLTLCKKYFKETMSHAYGEAFALVMDPVYIHDIYYDIFKRRAEVNIALRKYQEAEKDCNWAIVLRPQLAQPYHLRAIAGLNARNTYRVCDDLQKATSLGHTESPHLLRKHCINH